MRIDHSDLLGRAVRVFAQPLGRLAGALTGDGIDDMHRNGEARLIRLLLPFLGARSVVMDVGANIGNWSAFLLDLAPAVSLHAFEPNPAAHAELRRNLPGRAGVATHQLALGSAPAKATLYSDPRHSVLSSLHHRDLGSFGVSLAGELEVSVETVDRFCAANEIDRVALMKLDVEGHELDVLRGAQAMLSSGRIEAVQFEYGGTYLDAGVRLADVFDLLAAMSYELYKLVPWGLVRVTDVHRRDEAFQLSNFAGLSPPIAAALR